ncbi:hypothetical protein MMC25_006046 [Agyrium rufum]|nr:hypothetical protein [Agyrium rufum]
MADSPSRTLKSLKTTADQSDGDLWEDYEEISEAESMPSESNQSRGNFSGARTALKRIARLRKKATNSLQQSDNPETIPLDDLNESFHPTLDEVNRSTRIRQEQEQEELSHLTLDKVKQNMRIRQEQEQEELSQALQTAMSEDLKPNIFAGKKTAMKNPWTRSKVKHVRIIEKPTLTVHPIDWEIRKPVRRGSIHLKPAYNGSEP